MGKVKKNKGNKNNIKDEKTETKTANNLTIKVEKDDANIKTEPVNDSEILPEKTKLNKTINKVIKKTKKPSKITAETIYDKFKQKVAQGKKSKKTKSPTLPTKFPDIFASSYLTPEEHLEQFKTGISTLLTYDKYYKPKDLFHRDKPIFLQIETFKIPICSDRNIRVELPHSLKTEKSEVCLFVSDLRRGRNVDHSQTVDHYEELFNSLNIRSVQRIIPLRQLRVEYDQYELKRQLCGYYDIFLVDGRVAGHVTHLIGKSFIRKRKIPVPISMDANKLKDSIERGLKKTHLHVHSKGTTFMIQFGHNEMSVEQLLENLQTVACNLFDNFPGGWKNIRALFVRTDKSIAIPIYMNIVNPNKVPVPVITPKRPKAFEKVTDELSTLPGAKVTVHPSGKVDVIYKSNKKENSSKQLKNTPTNKQKKVKKNLSGGNKIKEKTPKKKVLKKKTPKKKVLKEKNNLTQKKSTKKKIAKTK